MGPAVQRTSYIWLIILGSLTKISWFISSEQIPMLVSTSNSWISVPFDVLRNGRMKIFTSFALSKASFYQHPRRIQQIPQLWNPVASEVLSDDAYQNLPILQAVRNMLCWLFASTNTYHIYWTLDERGDKQVIPGGEDPLWFLNHADPGLKGGCTFWKA